MPYRLKPGVHLVCVKDHAGKVNYHYATPRPKSGDFGPIITSISPEQAAYLIRIGFIERIDDEPPNAATTDESELDQLVLSESLRDGLDADRVHACIEAIAALGMNPGIGAPKVRDGLRSSGQQWPNDIICAAVRARKAAAGVPV